MASSALTIEHAFALARSGRKSEGLALLTRLSEGGNADASFYLGETYWVGGPVPTNHSKARDYFERAGAAGHKLAQITHTNLLASGIAGERDWPAARRRLEAEARGDPKRARQAKLLNAMDLTADGDPAAVPAGEALSLSPDVRLFRGVVSEDECDYLMAGFGLNYRPAKVGDGKGGERLNPYRDCDEATIHCLIEDPAVHALNRRIAALSGSDCLAGEPLQLLRYRPGQQYRSHVDWLDNHNRRVLTVLVYLNDDYQGGETHFVKVGLKVKGRLGDVLVFRNDGPDRKVDLKSEHAGLPVVDGTKFIASRWIHERRYAP